MKRSWFRQSIIISLIVVLWIFQNWIISPVNLGGDFNFVDYGFFRSLSTEPYIWDSRYNNGFGQLTLYILPFFPYNFIFNLLTLPFTNTFFLHKIIYLWPILLVSFGSITILARKIIKNEMAQGIAVIIYLINPYFMMLTSGGQMGVALAYGFTPLVFYVFIRLVESINNHGRIVLLRDSLIAGAVFALLIILDTRIAILTAIALVIMFFGNLWCSNQKIQVLKRYVVISSIVGVAVLGVHAFWIIPSYFVQAVALPAGYGTADSVKFFSFARLAHTITASHPNYPENYFGVVKEVSGVAFLLPLLAFLFMKSQSKKQLYFVLVALVSIFLAKGANPPLGEIYVWLFQNIPGFSVFRDSTKFYLLIALSFSILIGLNTQKIIEHTGLKGKLFRLAGAVAVCLILFIPWSDTIGVKLDGTTGYKQFPKEFSDFNQILSSDQSFGRVLWIPVREYYAVDSPSHPAVFLKDLRNPPQCFPVFCLPEKKSASFNDSSLDRFNRADLLKEIDVEMEFLTNPETEQLFRKFAINYIAISPDIDKTIYIYDRKHDPTIYGYYKNKIENIEWLNKTTSDFLYQTKQNGPLLSQSQNDVSFRQLNPTKYAVKLDNLSDALEFSQTFDPRWVLKSANQKVYAEKSEFGLNRFQLISLDQQEVSIEFEGQEYATIGWKISLTFLISLFLTIVVLNKVSKKAKTP